MAEGFRLETDHGIVISDLEPDGPAVKAGLQADDIVTGLNGRTVTSVHEMEAYIFRLSPGTSVTPARTARHWRIEIYLLSPKNSRAKSWIRWPTWWTP